MFQEKYNGKHNDNKWTKIIYFQFGKWLMTILSFFSRCLPWKLEKENILFNLFGVEVTIVFDHVFLKDLLEFKVFKFNEKGKKCDENK